MRILYLIEVAANIWGGVRSALEDANALQRRGHTVTVLSKSAAPTWMPLDCTFVTVPDFEAHNLPAADFIIAASLEAVPFAGRAGQGIPIHYVQGYEGGDPQWADLLDKIEAIYSLYTHKICISKHLQELVETKFRQKAHLIPYFVDHATCYPTLERAVTKPVRVGLVGPYDLSLKDIRTGIEACSLASQAGLELQLVRVTNTQPHSDEQALAFPVEWHQQVHPAQMGDIYRSLDLFIGTSRGDQEGFFLPAVEAMACGIPVVLTDTVFHHGYGDSQYALFVDPMSPVQMAEGIVLMSTNPEARSALREAGLNTAAQYRHETHLDALESVLNGLMASATPASPAVSTPVSPAAPIAAAPSTPPEPSITPDSTHPTLPTDLPLPQPGFPEPTPEECAIDYGSITPQSALTLTPTGGLEPQITPPTSEPQMSQDDLDQLASSLATSLVTVASLHTGREQYSQAAEMLRAALIIKPDDLQIAQRLAYAQYLAGNDKQALELYDSLVNKGLLDTSLYSNRGFVHFSQGNLTAAITDFETAIRNGDQSAETMNNLGVARFKSGDQIGAQEAFQKALSTDPNHADASANLRGLTTA